MKMYRVQQGEGGGSKSGVFCVCNIWMAPYFKIFILIIFVLFIFVYDCFRFDYFCSDYFSFSF